MTEKTDMERIGLFKEMGYHTINDPFKPFFFSSRQDIIKGKGFLGDTTRTKAANDDGYFTKPFTRVFEGESETNLMAMRRRWRNQNKEKNIGKTFIMSNPGKKQSGTGSRMGCMDYMIPYFSGVTRTVRDKLPTKKNFITNPGKKGSGYGYNDVCLNPYPEWKSDGYDSARNMYFRKEMAEHKSKTLNRKEFIPTNAYGSYFYSNPYEGGMGPYEEKHGKTVNYLQKRPFIPGSYPKVLGGNKDGCLTPYPPAFPAEYRDKFARDLIHDVRNNTNKLYNHTPGSKSCIFQSVLQKNVNFRVNNLNSHSIRNVMNY